MTAFTSDLPTSDTSESNMRRSTNSAEGSPSSIIGNELYGKDNPQAASLVTALTTVFAAGEISTSTKA
jgi:hypothetical protein